MGLSVVTLGAQPRLHLQHEDGRVGAWELDCIRFKASLMYEPPKPDPNARLVGAGDLEHLLFRVYRLPGHPSCRYWAPFVTGRIEVVGMG